MMRLAIMRLQIVVSLRAFEVSGGGTTGKEKT